MRFSTLTRIPKISLVCLAWFFIAGCGSSAHNFVDPPPSPAAAPIGHVVLVVEENHSFSEVIGNAAMPYFNSLASTYGLATQYYADTHPSIGNYFMMTTGQIVSNDDNFAGTVSADNLAREITASGKRWKVYAQSLPAVGYTGGDQYPYLRRHDPFSYFSDTAGGSASASQIVPITELAADIAAGSLPDFLFIVPDAQHDGHDCPAGMTSCTENDELAAADAWLQQNIAPLLASASFQNGVLVVVFDESAETDTQHGGGHVAMVIAGSPLKNGFQSGTLMQHETLLRFACDRLQLMTCPGAGASTASAMNEFLH